MRTKVLAPEIINPFLGKIAVLQTGSFPQVPDGSDARCRTTTAGLCLCETPRRHREGRAWRRGPCGSRRVRPAVLRPQGDDGGATTPGNEPRPLTCPSVLT